MDGITEAMFRHDAYVRNEGGVGMEVLYYNEGNHGQTKRICSLDASDTIGDIAGLCHLTVGELSDILVEIVNKDLESFKCKHE